MCTANRKRLLFGVCLRLGVFVWFWKGIDSGSNAFSFVHGCWLASSRMKGEASCFVFHFGYLITLVIVAFDDFHGGIELRSGGWQPECVAAVNRVIDLLC
jgi:hypothetical protein